MKKISAVLAALCGIAMFFCACTQNTEPPSNAEESIKIESADDLAQYIRYYYYNHGYREDTEENHYILDKNYSLSVNYSTFSTYDAVPDYPENAYASVLPYSLKVVKNNGSALLETTDTAYGSVNSPADYYFRSTQTKRLYYDAKSLTGYVNVGEEHEEFTSYPDFQPAEQTFAYDGKWTFTGEEQFDEARDGGIDFYTISALCYDVMSDLFRIELSDWSDGLPTIDEALFSVMSIVQSGSTVSFEIRFESDECRSYASGTLDVESSDFAYTYEKCTFSGGETVGETAYSFSLCVTDGEYDFGFDTSGDFTSAPDYIAVG